MFEELSPDDDIVSPSTDDNAGSPDRIGSESTLKLKSMTTEHDMDSYPDEIEKQLVLSIKTNKLVIDPQYAVMDLRQNVSSTGTELVSNVTAEIPAPISPGEYDTYNFGTLQVKT